MSLPAPPQELLAAAATAGCELLPLRLLPGDDLRRALEAAVVRRGHAAAFVLAGIGSLGPACIRLAGATETRVLADDLELLTIAGSVAPEASHLHISVADATGRVLGGHAAYGCRVRTTAELLLALLPGWRFSREPDTSTGYAELVVRRRHAAGPGNDIT